jgi:glycosyltransferase involved in cell wall biosynthesis
MQKKKVLYYTSTAFMDVSVEIIKVVKSLVELHVLIELTPGSKNENIINIDTLPQDQVFVPVQQLLKPQDYALMQPYFDGVASINFIVHNKKSLTTSLGTSVKAFQYIRKIGPDIFHLEALQIRSVGLLPSLLLVKKLLIAVHDPVPHSGETSWKINLTRSSFHRFPVRKGYILYSAFAKKQFDLHHPQLKSPRYVLQLQPYTYYRNYLPQGRQERKHILFFGRLSPYKGIDILLQAAPQIFKQYPNELLVIAGKSFEGYVPDPEVVAKYPHNIRVINRYISNEELVLLISEAKFVVCPYKDATQSGVLMTAYALQTPVIATNVGAFPETIEHNRSGMLVPVGNAEKLAEAMLKALDGAFYKEMEAYLAQTQETSSWTTANKAALLQAYDL